MEFGLYYCKDEEFKFQFKGSERPVVRPILFTHVFVYNLFIGKFQTYRAIFE